MKIDLFKPIFRSFLLTVLTSFATKGYYDQALVEPTIAAAMALLVFGWQLYDRKQINDANKKSNAVAEVVSDAVGVEVKDLPASKEAIKNVVVSKIGKTR